MPTTSTFTAFYTAVASNESARQLMQQDKLRELAVVLTERVRQNTSIDCKVFLAFSLVFVDQNPGHERRNTITSTRQESE